MKDLECPFPKRVCPSKDKWPVINDTYCTNCSIRLGGWKKSILIRLRMWLKRKLFPRFNWF